jgi:nitroreductase
VPVHVIAYAVDPGAARGSPLLPRALWGSIYPAVWSFQLALRARGLGTTPLLVTDEAGLAAVVGAPATAPVASLLPVAYYTGETFRPAGRRPVDEVLSWDRWGEAVPVAP